MSSEARSIYIQALYQQGEEGAILSKWYKIPNCVEDGEKKHLDPVFDGPPNGLSASASVSTPSGSRIYVLGGVENKGKSPADIYTRHDFLSNKVYFRDIHNPNTHESAWEQCPTMIRARGGHRAVICKGKVYVFGSRIRMFEEGEEGDYRGWNTYAECLELNGKSDSMPAAAWEALRDPVYKENVNWYAIHHDKYGQELEIVLGCNRSNMLLSYDVAESRWDYSHDAVGCYHCGVYMNGVIYGAEHSYGCSDRICALDYKCLMGSMLAQNDKPEHHLLDLDGRVLPSGLVAVDQETLCVFTGGRSISRDNSDFEICCTKYKISATRVPYSGEIILCRHPCNDALVISCELLSRSTYYLKDVISVEGCLLVPPFEQKDDCYSCFDVDICFKGFGVDP